MRMRAARPGAKTGRDANVGTFQKVCKLGKERLGEDSSAAGSAVVRYVLCIHNLLASVDTRMDVSSQLAARARPSVNQVGGSGGAGLHT